MRSNSEYAQFLQAEKHHPGSTLKEMRENRPDDPPTWLTPRYGRTMLTELAIVMDDDDRYWELAGDNASDLEWHDARLSAAELAQMIQQGERPTIGWIRRSTVKR